MRCIILSVLAKLLPYLHFPSVSHKALVIAPKHQPAHRLPHARSHHTFSSCPRDERKPRRWDLLGSLGGHQRKCGPVCYVQHSSLKRFMYLFSYFWWARCQQSGCLLYVVPFFFFFFAQHIEIAKRSAIELRPLRLQPEHPSWVVVRNLDTDPNAGQTYRYIQLVFAGPRLSTPPL